ncbi:VCBS repeat-containing protein [candidate division KSB1 bacterium]|nr:VCBS repeat-containing protein [candidate division KSB1 bacterium]
MTPLHKRILILTFCTLFSSIVRPSEEPVVFDAVNKPLRPFAHVRYAPISNTPPLHSIQTGKSQAGLDTVLHQLETHFAGGRQLVGRVTLTLTPSIQTTDSIVTTLVLRDNGLEHQMESKAFTPDGTAELQFYGTFAESMLITIAGVAGTNNPIEHVSVEKIVLGDKNRIMLLGDSITEAHYDTSGAIAEGYRHKLYHKLINAYPDIDFVGTSGDEPYEAHCDGGKRISAFLQNGSMDIRGPMNTFHPRMVAIHLGTNEINNYENPVKTAEDMRKLINYLLQWRYDDLHNLVDPEIRLEHIIISLVMPAKYRDELCIETNRQIALVVDEFISGRETGRSEPVYAADHFSRFREWPPSDANRYYDLMWDRLHPNNQGHELMAVTYFDVFDGILSGPGWFTDISFLADIIGRDYYYPNNTTTHFSHHAVAIADVNNDGADDVYLTRSDYDNQTGHDEFYLRQPSLPYATLTEDYHLLDAGGSRGAVFVDIDNDGDFDLFNGNSPGPNKLYQNQDGAGFIQLANIGIEKFNATTTGVAAFDAENDGDMDLLAINAAHINEFYLNDGTGFLTSVDRGLRDEAGSSISCYTVAPADFDNDGDTDVFITSRDAPNKLFVNDGTGHFSDGTAAAGLSYSGRSNGASWSDLDLDGDLDLIVSESRTSVGEKILLVFENDGHGRFSNLSTQLDIPVDSYSTLIADYNNDTFDDLLITFENEKAVLWENHGNWFFQKVMDTGAEINGGDSRGGAVLDYDDDGDVDILVARSDMLNILLQNNTSGAANYLKITAMGPGGNRGGFGTKIWLYEAGHLNDPDYLIGHREIVSTSGHMSQPSPRQHFGLASNNTIDLTARFTDGSYIAQCHVSANQTILIEPGKKDSSAGAPARIEYYSGTDQYATAGQQLPRPAQVRVTDSKGLGVPDVYVDFSVTQGDAQLFLPNTSSDKISIEAESGRYEMPLKTIDLLEASDGSAVFKVPFSSGTGTSILWQKDFSTAGDYFLWLRVLNTSGAQQSLPMTINGQIHNASASPRATWEWIRINGDSPLTLAAGQHTFELQLTEVGLQIDKLLFVADKNYLPAGLEEDSNEPNLTNSQGIAQRYVQLGTRAGAVTIEAHLTFNGQLLPDSPITFNATSLPGPVVRMVKTSGDEQHGEPNIELAQPFVVTLYDAFDNPVPDEPVTFTALSPGGMLNPGASSVTDQNGHAQALYTPDGSASRQQVKAEAANISPVFFTAYISGIAVKMELLSPKEVSGTVMQPIAFPVRVKVTTDSLTNEPAVDYAVHFSTTAIAARLSSSANFGADSALTVMTSEEGFAQVYWRLGEKSGAQTLTIHAGDISGSPCQVTATAAPDDPAVLLLLEGNNQSASVSTRLDKAFRVRVTDIYRNPVPNIPVTFSSTSDGSFGGTSILTRNTTSSGEAHAYYTLGHTAGYKRVATVEAHDNTQQVGSPIDFYATILAGEAYTAAIHSGNGQTGIVDSEASEPLAIVIRDAFGNPVADFDVTFTALDGGSLQGEESALISTNEKGIASVRYHIGKVAGRQRVGANTPGLIPESLEFIIHAQADDATKISEMSGNFQIGATNTTLAEPLVVRVSDRYGNDVPDHPVTFAVKSPEGSINGNRNAALATDSLGLAHVYFTLGETLGDSIYIVQAHSSNQNSALKNSPITFYASARIGEPFAIHVVSDTSDLVGAALAELPEPIRIKIVDRKNQPIAGFEVKFQVVAGNGFLRESKNSQFYTPTNSEGEATAHWVLGQLGLKQQLWIFPRDGRALVNSPVKINAKTVKSAPYKLEKISGNNQSGTRGQQLANPLVVKIVDTNKTPVADQMVFFTTSRGDGLFKESLSSNYAAKTNSSGLASTYFILGDSVGHKAYEIVVRAFNNQGRDLYNSPDTFYAHGLSRELVKISGDRQSGTVNMTLAQALRVRLIDENYAGIAGESVLFEIASGTLHLIGSPLQQTDSHGYAQVKAKWDTLAGRITVKATATLFASSVYFNLVALPDAPYALHKISGDAQVGVTHHPLNQKIVVRVTDRYRNGISGSIVQFETQPGHGAVSPSPERATDSTGYASVEWTLGSVIPRQYLFVKARTLASSVSFSADALRNQAPQIAIADSFRIAENEKLEFTLSIQDAENDSFAVTANNLPDGAVFDPETMGFSWKPSFEQAGVYWIIFQARDEFGATTIKSVKISVHNANRAPQISLEESRPLEHRLGKVRIPGVVNFYVSASDPDGDNLFYLWRVNGKTRGTVSTFQLNSQLYDAGDLIVKAEVYDRADTVSTSWMLELVTSVELVSFIATHEPYRGARLTWNTRHEWGNTGFYVLRSERQDGPFEPISPLIKSIATGKYHFLDEQIESDILYYYRVQSLLSNGSRQDSESISFRPQAPERFGLAQNYPNPFNPSTTIRFNVAFQSHVTLVIYDMLGRRVRTLIDGNTKAGYHKLTWLGDNDVGERLASAIYYCVLKTDAGQFLKKMVLLR